MEMRPPTLGLLHAESRMAGQAGIAKRTGIFLQLLFVNAQNNQLGSLGKHTRFCYEEKLFSDIILFILKLIRNPQIHSACGSLHCAPNGWSRFGFIRFHCRAALHFPVSVFWVMMLVHSGMWVSMFQRYILLPCSGL